MFKFPYKILIIKNSEHKPARLDKAIDEQNEYDKLRQAFNTKLNIILLIVLLILFLLLCYTIVPQTYGVLWY